MANRYRDRPFPADDEFGRDPSHEPSYGSPQQGESDPLAELARLIGQTDPFSNFGRDQQQARPQPSATPPSRSLQTNFPPPRREAYPAMEPEPEPDYDEPAPTNRPSWLQNLSRARQTPPPAPSQPFAEPGDHEYDDPLHDTGYGGQAPRFDERAYGARDPLPVSHGRDAYGAQDDRYDDVLYGQMPDACRDNRFADHNSAYGDGGYDEQLYADAPDEAPRQRRGGMLTVIAVLLLAIVGTGAAFAYRTFVGSSRSGEPLVVRADPSPTKMIPAGSNADNSGKQITDRIGGNTERVVSREEQPVDMNAKTGPRVVFPPLTQNANPPTPASASTATRPTGAGVGNGTLGGEEPRKIRTLSIRPDQPDSAAAAPAAQPAAAPPRAQQAARTPAPASTASTGAAPNAAAPMSLSPQAAPAQPQRVASVNPTGNTGAGGAFVQVSSQKTEADAKASFRALQGKYSSILGSRTASIHRADLGTKGVFYRAMVGPFGSGEEASQFCSSLKSAGGQCVVAR